MSTSLRTETVKTLREFTDLVESVMNQGNATPWYRGCGRSSYTLMPTLYRRPAETDPSALFRLEASIICRFKQRCVPYLPRSLTSDWEALFLMQHFGVPTRLLDWTESPFIALYFAITSSPSAMGQDGPLFSADAAVWILDPVAWNRHVLQHLSYAEGVLSVGDPPLTGYAPGPEGPTHKEAVALFGTHNSPRIVAQRGVFTIFGHNTRPMEEVYESEGLPDGALVKVNLPTQSLADLNQSISAVGITDSVVWPELDGLAKEIRRQFGYEV